MKVFRLALPVKPKRIPREPAPTGKLRARMDAAPKICAVCGARADDPNDFCFGCDSFTCREHGTPTKGLDYSPKPILRFPGAR